MPQGSTLCGAAAESGAPAIRSGGSPLPAGGALETVVPLGRGEATPTGMFFEPQTVDALAAAMRAFETHADRFEGKALRVHAERFDRPIFKQRIAAYLAELGAC